MRDFIDEIVDINRDTEKSIESLQRLEIARWLDKIERLEEAEKAEGVTND